VNSSTLIAAALAGAAYTLTPGPGVLALLGIGASQGRAAGARFLGGHFAGDVMWGFLALLAIIGARRIGALFFDALGLVCGAYLAWLGWRALRTRHGAEAAVYARTRRPLLSGLAFGLTNPKSYPVALATFTALLSGEAGRLAWSNLPPLLGAACLGFVMGDIVLVSVAGAARERRLYRRHETWIVRASGLVFLGFAVHAVLHALPGLAGRRS
jgi:threonine/homoserine/homoserine lactone efflux protein